ncbi:MAG: bifunctional folylpolyglutamate synthase/dihydrofolate synthase [Candidatus Omnitrophica bacterium]|nr:bifunctional folylpolyglutamate synthase/dihydrofolate synthase [Candidatus Omnitrophota bacterium]
MTYQEALQYLNSFINYEKLDDYDYKKSLKLDRIKKLAGLLGNPQDGIRGIHIAGTKGKGSTAAFLHSILKNAGFKVGLYTSPHLISFRERIRINDELISEKDLSRLAEAIKDAVRGMVGERPSFFEAYTGLAYLYFKEKRVDFAIYEVGLGGRLDATNIIEPLVSAITPISYEHTQKLGNTLREIAGEKAGIIKENRICISAPQEEEALKVIKKICEEKRARLILVGKDILFEELYCDGEREVFSIFGLFNEYPVLATGLLGSHQVVNAATAIGITEALRFHGITISLEAVRNGVRDAKWEGRLEVLSRRPFVILDGAQNRASAYALAKAVKRVFSAKGGSASGGRYRNLILVLGVSRDKDIVGILEELAPISDSIILTKSKVLERALEPSLIKEHIKKRQEEVVLTSSVEEALTIARSKADSDDLILVTGSLFVVGEAKAFMAKEPQHTKVYQNV